VVPCRGCPARARSWGDDRWAPPGQAYEVFPIASSKTPMS
jgi:hypothetical protein